jgi:hypothetical protein
MPQSNVNIVLLVPRDFTQSTARPNVRPAGRRRQRDTDPA